MDKKNKTKGFSLVEILAAIVILGLLSTIAIVSVNYILRKAEQEYYNENDPVYTYANGGVTNNNLAFVDNNEVLRDIYGNLTEVPNTKKGTDNHLINATTLDSVLSDKIKKPSTNKTFAEEGKKLVKMTKKSKGTDRFAEASNRLNEYNANKQYEALLDKKKKIETPA